MNRCVTRLLQASRFHGGMDGFQQGVIFEGLGDESGRAPLQRERAGFRIVVGGYENNGRSIVIGRQPALKFKATHPRQAEIQDQTIRTTTWIKLQKLFG